jgi:tetratricopeptide (TPR) repeat protein
MRDLFEDDMVTEELSIQEMTRTRILPPGSGSEREALRTRTAVLGPDELPGGSRISWKRVAAGLAVCLVVLTAAAVLYLVEGNAPAPERSVPPQPPPEARTQPPPASETSPIAAGRKALEEKRYDEAAALFKGLLEIDPSLAGAVSEPYELALLGQAEAARNAAPRKAEQLLIKAAAVNPQSVKARFQLGLLYVKLEDYAKALDAFQRAARLDPSFADTYFNLGYVYAMTRDYARAEEMYARVVDLAPMYLDEAYYNLAMVQERAGKTRECILNLEQAIAVNPENGLAGKNLKRLKAKEDVP